LRLKQLQELVITVGAPGSGLGSHSFDSGGIFFIGKICVPIGNYFMRSQAINEGGRPTAQDFLPRITPVQYCEILGQTVRLMWDHQPWKSRHDFAAK